MAFLLDPNISTTDIWTTLTADLYIEHDMLTVQWAHSDLEVLPRRIATSYASIMGVNLGSSTAIMPGATMSHSEIRPTLTSSPRTSSIDSLRSIMTSTHSAITTTPASSVEPSHTAPRLHATTTASSPSTRLTCWSTGVILMFSLLTRMFSWRVAGR
ncbi:hypothetical protein GGR56DRAFT_637960 [Xylariaceae sp. FL0804]|nr:hypothetical protein GGR56DRAFT_637960 [Xylariaceae sp. FL0804]